MCALRDRVGQGVIDKKKEQHENKNFTLFLMGRAKSYRDQQLTEISFY